MTCGAAPQGARLCFVGYGGLAACQGSQPLFAPRAAGKPLQPSYQPGHIGGMERRVGSVAWDGEWQEFARSRPLRDSPVNPKSHHSPNVYPQERGYEH